MPAGSDETIVLSVNSGSSSLKVALYSFRGERVSKLAGGEAEEIGSVTGRIRLRLGSQEVVEKPRSFSTVEQAYRYLLDELLGASRRDPDIVGHRVVHGGPKLLEHQRVTPDVLTKLEQAVEFAPLHLPVSLRLIQQAITRFPEVPQVACFDTAFHRNIPECASRFPLAQEFWEQGLRRFGFHGLSCESIVHALADDLRPRTVIAHLGNGCSVTAVQNGKSIDNTMGLTPTGGVMMGTRSGDLDPGLLLYLQRVNGYEFERLDNLLNHQAGLLGVSGRSSDMRQLLESESHDPNSHLAVEMFCYQVRKAIGAMGAALDGIDMLVFSGGIGEHAAPVRARVCAGLGYLQFVLDEHANRQNGAIISSAESKSVVRIVKSDEDLEIAVHCMLNYVQ